MKKLSIFDAIMYSFKTVLDNFKLFFGAFAIFFGIFLFAIPLLVLASPALFIAVQQMTHCSDIACVSSVAEGFIDSFTFPLLFFGLILLLFFLYVVLWAGYVRMALDLRDTGTSRVRQLFSCFRISPKILVAHILYLLMVVIGLIAFVFPGIYLALRLGLYQFFIIDKNSGIIQSLKQSYAATKGHGWELFGLGLILMIIKSVPLIAIIFPIVVLAYVFVYRELIPRGQNIE